MVAITMLWVVNIIYYNSRKIEKPIFFRHLLETSLESSLVINYIEDIDSEGKFKYIKIPELGEQPIYIRGNNRSVVYSDKHYNYCSLFIDLGVHYGTYNDKTKEYIPKVKGEKMFTKIIYGTSNGKEYIEDVGKIYIRDYDGENNPKFIEEISNGSSLEEDEKFPKVYTEYKCEKGVKLTGYNAYLKNEIQGMVDIKINDVDIKDIKFPIDVNKYFKVESSLKKDLDKNKDIPEFYSVILDLYFENSKGEKQIVSFNVGNGRYLTRVGDIDKKEVDNLIKIRRENK